MTLEELYARDLDDLRTVMGTPEGARFVSWILDFAGVWRLSYNGEETHATAFKEGARNVGLALLSRLDAAREDARQRLWKADEERRSGGWPRTREA